MQASKRLAALADKPLTRSSIGPSPRSAALLGERENTASAPPPPRPMRGPHAPIHLLLRKSGELGVAFDDGFALGVGEDVVDVGETVRRAALDLVDYALGSTLAVVAHDLGR